MDLSHVESLTWRRALSYKSEKFRLTEPLRLNENIKHLHIEDNTLDPLPRFTGVLGGESCSIRFGFGKDESTLQLFDQRQQSGLETIIPIFKNLAIYNATYDATPSPLVPSAQEEAIFIYCTILNPHSISADTVLIHLFPFSVMRELQPPLEITLGADSVKDVTIFRPKLESSACLSDGAAIRLHFDQMSSTMKMYFMIDLPIARNAFDNWMLLKDKVIIYHGSNASSTCRVFKLNRYNWRFYIGMFAMLQKTLDKPPTMEYSDENISGKVIFSLGH